MKTTYVGLATVAMVLLTLTTFARADVQTGWPTPPIVSQQDTDGQPLGLLWDEDWLPFDEEIIIRDGLIYT